MQQWNEIRTAATVARLGTVSAAADAINVHRATITRHIDTLEGALGAKLFQRSRRGFLPTDLGRRLLRIAEASEEQFDQLLLHARSQAEVIEGDLVIASIAQMAEHLFPVIAEIGRRYPLVKTHFLASQDLARLEYGEAHVALRVGTRPQDPDNVVRAAGTMRMGLYAHRAYTAQYGLPGGEAELAGHRFVGSDAANPRAPFMKWMVQHIPPQDIVLASSDIPSHTPAVLAGVGIGFVPQYLAADHPELVEVLPPRTEWDVPLWLVTHVDLNRTPKVRAFLDLMADPAAGWRFT